MSASALTAADFTPHRDVGVGWMNRGHALQQNGRLGEAIAAYENAISVLRALPIETNPAWANSLGAAWMNHGQLLHRAYGTAWADRALASFESATVVLRHLPFDQYPWARRNFAGTLLNRANLLLDRAQLIEASAAIREALSFCLPHEHAEPVDADLALKSRRALCDTIGQLLVAPGSDQDALAGEASDLTDDALTLIRHWTDRGENSFHPLALRFFRYGTQLYRFHQPHFLAEFIRENLALNELEFRDIALNVIHATLADRPRSLAFLTVGDPASERHFLTSRELEHLRSSLGQPLSAARARP